MLAQDYIQESTVNNVDEPRLMESNMEDEREEDTLSLCDLPISWESQSSSTLLSLPSHTAEFDYFEFFSEELSKNSFSRDNHHVPENIIFGGQLIPSRKPILENPLNIAQRKQKKWYNHFQCTFSLPFYRKKSSSRKRDGDLVINREITENNISVLSDKVMSIIPSSSSLSLSSSSGRRRWYLFLFGISKLPTKMGLSDLRNRRSIHQINSSISFSSVSSTSLQLKNTETRDFWWVIRALNCGGSYHAQAMVNAPIGRFSTTKV